MDPEIRGPNWLGTICLGGPNFWGPFVQGDRIGWGPFDHRIDFMGIVCPGGQEVGDRKSGDQMGSEPNVSQTIMMQCNKSKCSGLYI